MPVNGAMPEEIVVECGWIIRRPCGEYVLMLDAKPEDWGAQGRVEVTEQEIRLRVRGRTRAFLRRIDPRVTTAILGQHHLKVIAGYDAMVPVLNACDVAEGARAGSQMEGAGG
jgi:hypothetical protein